MNDAQTAGDAGPLDLLIDAKSYRSADGEPVDVIRHLALHLDAGEFGALIGPSGCGKTTILKIIAGLDRDYSGTCRGPGHGRLGVVFQEPRLLPWRSVEDNIRLAMPDGEAPVDLTDLVATLGLREHLGRYPGELSLGLARRAAIARAFAIRPDFLLLDEPFVSLDEATAARLRDELLTLTMRERVTTLMVTHDIDEAAILADRLLLLSGRPAQIVRNHRIAIARGSRDTADVAAIAAEMRQHVARG